MGAPRRFSTYTPVGAAIARARRRAGLTQEKLASRLNREQSFVAKVEGGTREVEVREFLWIIQRIGFDPIPLLSRMLIEGNFRDLQDRPKQDRTKPGALHRTERRNPGVDDWDDYADVPDDDGGDDDDENVLGNWRAPT